MGDGKSQVWPMSKAVWFVSLFDAELLARRVANVDLSVDAFLYYVGACWVSDTLPLLAKCWTWRPVLPKRFKTADKRC